MTIDDLEPGDHVLCRGMWTILRNHQNDGRLVVYEPILGNTGTVDRDEVQNWHKATP